MNKVLTAILILGVILAATAVVVMVYENSADGETVDTDTETEVEGDVAQPDPIGVAEDAGVEFEFFNIQIEDVNEQDFDFEYSEYLYEEGIQSIVYIDMYAANNNEDDIYLDNINLVLGNERTTYNIHWSQSMSMGVYSGVVESGTIYFESQQHPEDLLALKEAEIRMDPVRDSSDSMNEIGNGFKTTLNW